MAIRRINFEQSLGGILWNITQCLGIDHQNLSQPQWWMVLPQLSIEVIPSTLIKNKI